MISCVNAIDDDIHDLRDWEEVVIVQRTLDIYRSNERKNILTNTLLGVIINFGFP